MRVGWFCVLSAAVWGCATTNRYVNPSLAGRPDDIASVGVVAAEGVGAKLTDAVVSELTARRRCRATPSRSGADGASSRVATRAAP